MSQLNNFLPSHIAQMTQKRFANSSLKEMSTCITRQRQQHMA